MAFDTNHLVLHIKRIVYSSIRLSYRSACDYPILLGIGILLLILRRLCPSLLAFVLSSSPVFLLTALLLGVLLSYGEPNVPWFGEEISKDQQMLPLKPKISITDCSMEEVENVTVETHTEKRANNAEVSIENRTFNQSLHDARCEASTPADTLMAAESFEHAESNVTVERGEHAEEVSEKAELQEGKSIKRERVKAKVQHQYQFGEFMSSCWQPVMRQDSCSDPESDLTDSSSDASIADIIPPQVEKETDEDDDNSTEEEDHDTVDEGTNRMKKNEDGETITWTEDNQKDVVGLSSLELEKNCKLEKSSKNFLKFELNMSLMHIQAADAMRKMEEASRFRVQIPSISTPRWNPFDDSEERVQLPHVPDSAPSVLPPRRNHFDLPFDQTVDDSSRYQETWSPHSYYSSPQRRRHGNFNGVLRQDKHSSRFDSCFVTGMESYQWRSSKVEKVEISGTDAHDSHSDSDTEQNQSNAKLFGSLEAHISEEIKILGAAISDAGVLEVNNGKDEGTINLAGSSYKTSSEAEDSINAGSQHSTLYPSSETTNSELHVVEASSIEEINSLFEHLKEEVLVQSVSESSIGKPSAVELEDEPGEPLSLDSGMHVIEATSAEKMNMLFEQLQAESNAQYGSSSEMPLVTKHNPEQTVDNSEMHIIDASSIEEIKSEFKQVHEEAQAHSLLQSAPADVLTANLEVIDEAQIKSVSQCPLVEESTVHASVDELSHYSELHVVETKSAEEISSLFIQLHEESELDEISESSSDIRKIEQSSEIHVLKASSIEELNSELTQLIEGAQICTASESTYHNESNQDMSSKLLTAGDQQTSDSSELQVIEARSVEDIDSFVKQQRIESFANVTLSSGLELHLVDASSVDEINSVLKKLCDEIEIHNVSDPTAKFEDRSSESEVFGHRRDRF